jgi:hypothetical protein
MGDPIIPVVLQLVASSSRVARLPIGFMQGEKPMGCEEGI